MAGLLGEAQAEMLSMTPVLVFRAIGSRKGIVDAFAKIARERELVRHYILDSDHSEVAGSILSLSRRMTRGY
jgi:transketolase C-terminal domain/subunit